MIIYHPQGPEPVLSELPDVSYNDDDDDHEDDKFDRLPASSDDDGKISIASSDPLHYENASDVIVSTIILLVTLFLRYSQRVSSDDTFVTPTKKSRKHARSGAGSGGGGGDSSGEDDCETKRPRARLSMFTPRTQRLAAARQKQYVMELSTKDSYVSPYEQVKQLEDMMRELATKPNANLEHRATWLGLETYPERREMLLQFVRFSLCSQFCNIFLTMLKFRSRSFPSSTLWPPLSVGRCPLWVFQGPTPTRILWTSQRGSHRLRRGNLVISIRRYVSRWDGYLC